MRIPSLFRWPAVVALLAGAVALACTSSPHCNDRKADVTPPKLTQDFECITMQGATRDFVLYRTKSDGPPVLLLHEIPGLSDATFRLASLIAKEQYTVYVPLLFGKPGDFNATRNLIRHCVFGRDFDCLRNPTSSGRIVNELVVLANTIDGNHGGKGIGAVGMCLTGAIPLELVGRDVNVKAAMLSQPTLPILMKSELAVPQAAITKANDRKVKFVGARFQQDRKSPLVKMERLDSGLTHYNRHNIPSPDKGAHAVLTSWFKDEPGDPTRQALDDLLAIFKAELKGKKP